MWKYRFVEDCILQWNAILFPMTVGIIGFFIGFENGLSFLCSMAVVDVKINIRNNINGLFFPVFKI